MLVSLLSHSVQKDSLQVFIVGVLRVPTGIIPKEVSARVGLTAPGAPQGLLPGEEGQ